MKKYFDELHEDLRGFGTDEAQQLAAKEYLVLRLFDELNLPLIPEFHLPSKLLSSHNFRKENRVLVVARTEGG